MGAVLLVGGALARPSRISCARWSLVVGVRELYLESCQLNELLYST